MTVWIAPRCSSFQTFIQASPKSLLKQNEQKAGLTTKLVSHTVCCNGMHNLLKSSLFKDSGSRSKASC